MMLAHRNESELVEGPPKFFEAPTKAVEVTGNLLEFQLGHLEMTEVRKRRIESKPIVRMRQHHN